MNDFVISIRDLRKAYSGKEVLKGINIDISPGQIIGYIGPNGAGKSTTVKILCGLINEFQGSVTIAGMDLRKDSFEIKKHLGYVPETGALYELLTPREYLRFIGLLYEIEESTLDARISNLLSLFDMTGHADVRMDTFSKGMKQKILISGGLINNPDVIFLDEPLSGLDANSVILVKELLKKLASGGKTIFYCSHLMDVVEKISDRIILINSGVVMADGTFDELRNSNAITLEMLFAQITGRKEIDINTDILFNEAR